MVVFTCYHCGDSLQKPKVEKHITIECKKKYLNPKLTCIDCFKDFDRQTFVEHTKCVTEEQRYSGKGYVPKASSNKNEKKQQSWVEIIQAVLKKPQLNEFQRRLLKQLSGYSNVPRKLPKFRNFVNTSLKYLKVHNNTVEEVYKLIEEEFKLSQAANAPPKPAPKSDTADSQTSEKSEVEKLDVPNDKPAENNNKKDKLKDIENTSIPEETPTETVNPDETTTKEAKKSKKNKKENAENHDVTVSEESSKNANLDESVAFEVVKKKKKKSKKDKIETEIEAVNTETVSVENTKPSAENSRKSQENGIDQDIPMKDLSKKKLKKLKLQEVLENSPDDSQPTLTNGTVESEPSETVSKSTPVKEPESTENEEAMKNLSKKERKELKKKLKYEAELKAIENEVPPEESIADTQEEVQTVGNQKRDKKKKRKLSENATEDATNKKTKIIEDITNPDENVPTSRFSWEEVIRAILEQADGKEISMKKLTKKAVGEYQSCHGDEKPYEEVLKKFNKKVTKLPFVKILKDKVKLSV